MRNFLLTGMTFLTFSAIAVAQTQYCIGGSLDKLTPAQVAACKAKSADLHAEAQLQGEPRNWHFVVVCDEAGWDEYASFVDMNQPKAMDVLQQTDSATRLTVVRGSRIGTADRQKLDVVLAAVKGLPGVGVVARHAAAGVRMLAVSQTTSPGSARR